MRAGIIMPGIILSLGALMSDTATVDAQEKNEPPKTEKVMLRAWDVGGKKFFNPVEDIDAVRITTKDGKMWLKLTGKNVKFITGQPTRGSEITGKNGAVWLVSQVDGGPQFGYGCAVTLKTPAKKP